MIWHLLEVWLLVVLMFGVGCLAGAHLYGLIAGSRLAIAQGIVADAIGDALDRVKARVGMAPAWRPAHLRGVERSWPVERAEPDVPADAPEEDQPAVDVPDPEPVVAAIRTGETLEATRVQVGRSSAPTRRMTAVRRPDPPRLPAPAVAVPAPMRPSGIAAPRGGVPDNLQRIKGIGKRNEEMLNSLGIFHFGQIAAWTPSEIAWIGQHLTFPERVARDDWVRQATLLAMGSETGFQKSAERRRERRRHEREFGTRMANASDPYYPALDIGASGAAEAREEVVPEEEGDPDDEWSTPADDDLPDTPR